MRLEKLEEFDSQIHVYFTNVQTIPLIALTWPWITTGSSEDPAEILFFMEVLIFSIVPVSNLSKIGFMAIENALICQKSSKLSKVLSTYIFLLSVFCKLFLQRFSRTSSLEASGLGGRGYSMPWALEI